MEHQHLCVEYIDHTARAGLTVFLCPIAREISSNGPVIRSMAYSCRHPRDWILLVNRSLTGHVAIVGEEVTARAVG